MTPDYTNDHDAIVDEDHLVAWAGMVRKAARDMGCNWERFAILDQGKYLYRAWRKRPAGAYHNDNLELIDLQQIPPQDMLVVDAI